MDHCNTLRRCFGGIFEGRGLAFPSHLSAVARMHSGNDAHKSRFARAVLPHQQVYFAFAHLKIGVTERTDSTEALRYTS